MDHNEQRKICTENSRKYRKIPREPENRGDKKRKCNGWLINARPLQQRGLAGRRLVVLAAGLVLRVHLAEHLANDSLRTLVQCLVLQPLFQLHYVLLRASSTTQEGTRCLILATTNLKTSDNNQSTPWRQPCNKQPQRILCSPRPP